MKRVFPIVCIVALVAAGDAFAHGSLVGGPIGGTIPIPAATPAGGVASPFNRGGARPQLTGPTVVPPNPVPSTTPGNGGRATPVTTPTTPTTPPGAGATPTPGSGATRSPAVGGVGRGGVTGGRRKASGGAGRTTTKWGRTSQTPRIARLLDFRWIDASWPMRSSPEGYAQTLPLSALIHAKCLDPECTDLHCSGTRCLDPDCMRDKKPAMVYLYDPAETREKKADRERKMFGGTNDLAALSRFFHCFHMAADEAEAREYRSRHGKTFPALVFVGPDGKTVEVLEGNIGQARIRRAMARTIDHSYALDARKVLATLGELHADLERCEDELTVVSGRIAELEVRLRERGGQRTRDRLAKERRRLNETLREVQKLEERRQRLFSASPTCGSASSEADSH